MEDILRHLTNSQDFVEQRKAARLDVAVKVQYKVTGNQDCPKEAVTKDISQGGCLLVTGEDIPLNSEVELEISLGEAEQEALKLRGRIIRLNRATKGLYEFGISFAEISSEARRLFADYFFAKMYELIGLSEWPTDKRTKRE